MARETSADAAGSPGKILSKRMKNYVVRQRRKVQGWLSRIDAELFAAILSFQNRQGVTGGIMEIGVHHGRSFIPLSLSVKEGEVAIAIDVFDQQHLNARDPSGKGNFTKFMSNLQRYGSHTDVKIIKGSSLDLKAQDIKQLSGGLRFVSIDGAHWYSAVLNDLRLANACAARNCVIALDDLFNPDYAEVMAAYFSWLEERPDFVPFAFTRGKLYCCRPEFSSGYQSAMLTNNYLRFNCKKTLDYMGSPVLVFTGLYSRRLSFLKKVIELYAPRLHAYLKARYADDPSGASVARSPRSRESAT